MTTAELRELSAEDLSWEMLAAYEVADEPETWASLLGLDPESEASVALYDNTHEEYARLWTAMGDEFHERLRPLVGHWRRTKRRVLNGN